MIGTGTVRGPDNLSLYNLYNYRFPQSPYPTPRSLSTLLSMGDNGPNSPVPAFPIGTVSNYNHPESRAEVSLIVYFLSLALAVVFVALRLYSRIVVTRSTGWDDCGSTPVYLCF